MTNNPPVVANFSSLTIQDIADSLGVKISGPNTIKTLETEGQNYIKLIISSSNALCSALRSYKLSAVHLDMLLEAKNLPPLLGYDDSIPNYIPTPINVDQADIFGIKENNVPLIDTLQAPIVPYPTFVSHNYHWTLVEGIYADKKSASNSSSSTTSSAARESKLKQSRESKPPIERSVSVPNVAAASLGQQKSHFDGGTSNANEAQNINYNSNNNNNSINLSNINNIIPNIGAISNAPTTNIISRNSSVAMAIDSQEKADLKKCADDVLSGEQQKYFISTINLLRMDTVNSLDVALDMISDEDKMQPLLPYFIQYIFGKMELEMTNFKKMRVLIRLTLSLIQNKSLNIPFYAHSLFTIIYSALLSISISDNLYPDDTEVRRYAADALLALTIRCDDAFPQIRDLIFNSLIEALFDPDTSLRAQFGALLGIKVIGYVDRMISHFRSYLNFIKFELKSEVSMQSQAVESLLQLAKEILFEFKLTKCHNDNSKLNFIDGLIKEINSVAY